MSVLQDAMSGNDLAFNPLDSDLLQPGKFAPLQAEWNFLTLIN